MIVGIDLGTTNSLVGVMDSGVPLLLGDTEGRRLAPSIVRASPNGPPLAGWEAQQAEGDVIRSIKRLMGVRVGESPALEGQVGSIGEPARVLAGGREWAPEEVSCIILSHLKATAERALEMSITEAVITVPAYFHDGQRSATKRAAEMAGLDVRRLVPEPTAAALAFGLDRMGTAAQIAVFDLGGGTFDISILELRDGVFNVLSTNGDTRLGGDDIDIALAQEFQLTPAQAAEKKKNSEWYAANTTRIEEACRSVIERARPLCKRSLRDAGISASDLDEVILVGGATRMELVRQFAQDVFGRTPNTSQNPDEAVALGAAIQAGILDGTVDNVTLLDVTPLSLGVETFGGLMNVIIPRNTTIPAKAGEMFTNAASGQAAMKIRILQGEREMAADNWQLGQTEVPFEPMPRGQARVGVQFEIDANGILHVLARDTHSQRDITLEIESAIELTDEAIEKMLEDSLEHAFEDMDERRLAEATIKADEMLPAVTEALESGQATDEEVAAITVATEKVQAARESNNLDALTLALTELDQVTAELAARILAGITERNDSNH